MWAIWASFGLGAGCALAKLATASAATAATVILFSILVLHYEAAGRGGVVAPLIRRATTIG
jgi:hypothetical protein